MVGRLPKNMNLIWDCVHDSIQKETSKDKTKIIHRHGASPVYDDNTRTLSITYSDADGNLPWWRRASVCDPAGICLINCNMVPDSHSYMDSVQFSASFMDSSWSGGAVPEGEYEVHFWFSDSNMGEYPEAQIVFPITVGEGGGCLPEGDVNDDGVVNILDVVVTVNIVLCPECPGGNNPCADLNGDAEFNILDIVMMVNIILSSF